MTDIIPVVYVGVDTVEESMEPNFLVTRVGKKVSHSVPRNLDMSSKGLAWHHLRFFCFGFCSNVPRRRKSGPLSCSMGEL